MKAANITSPIAGHNSRGFAAAIAETDWNFSVRSVAPAIESIHPYPAKFIGEIPRTLLRLLPTPPGTLVLDPFCGSGTTLVEAQRAGFESIGVDLNPIACLASRVKTAPLRPGFAEAARDVVERSQKSSEITLPDIPNVDHWFKPEIQRSVGAIASTIALAQFDDWRDQLKLALSSILVRVSNQDSDTRYAAVEKNVTADDVFSGFSSACDKLLKATSGRDWQLPSSTIIEGNTLEIEPARIGQRVGMVITSPPYPNAYEYWLYHKYRMWWLGFDPLAVKAQEIGARAHFFKKNHHTAADFVSQMDKTFELISSVLVPRGFVCFVVGRSKIHGKIVDNGNIIERSAHKVHLTKVARVERDMNANRKSFNLSHANIKTESLLVFQKT